MSARRRSGGPAAAAGGSPAAVAPGRSSRRASSDNAAAASQSQALLSLSPNLSQGSGAKGRKRKHSDGAPSSISLSLSPSQSPSQPTSASRKRGSAASADSADDTMADVPPVLEAPGGRQHLQVPHGRQPPSIFSNSPSASPEEEAWPEERKSASAAHHAGASSAAAARAASDEEGAGDEGKSDGEDSDDADEYSPPGRAASSGGYGGSSSGGGGELLVPTLLPHAEVVDPADPFSSVDHRVTLMLRTLSPAYLPRRLPGLEAEQALLTELLARTLADSQNNAALLLGPKGSGKTALLNLCIANLRTEWSRHGGRELVVLRLSGPVQSDDTLALRALVSQLARDHELEPLKPSADFHTALAFLHDILAQGAYSHSGTAIVFVLEDFEHFVARPKQTLLYNLCDLLQSARARMLLLGVTSHLDCYERMEKRIRSRMSHRRIHVRATMPADEELLLLQASASADDDDLAAQEARALALRAKAEAAQKRELDDLVALLRDRMELDVKHEDREKMDGLVRDAAAEMEKQKEEDKKAQASASKRKAGAAASAAAAATPAPVVVPSATAAFCPSAAARAHNASLAALFSPLSSPRLFARLASLLAQGRTPRFFLSAARLAIGAALGARHPYLTEEDMLWALDHQEKDWTTRALAACSVLELTLLVSLLQLSRRGVTRLNFAQAFTCYSSFANRAAEGGGMVSAVARFSRAAAAKAWEELLSASSVLVWADGTVPFNPSSAHGGGLAQGDALYTGRQVQRDFEPVRLRVTEQEILDALRGGDGGAVKAPTWLVQWALRGLAE